MFKIVRCLLDHRRTRSHICEDFFYKTGLYSRNPNEMISRMF